MATWNGLKAKIIEVVTLTAADYSTLFGDVSCGLSPKNAEFKAQGCHLYVSLLAARRSHVYDSLSEYAYTPAMHGRIHTGAVSHLLRAEHAMHDGAVRQDHEN